jgi:chromosome segregation ATPase
MVEQHSRELATAAGSSSCAAVDVQLANEDVSRLEHEVRVATARTNELETAMQTATATLAEMIARADRLESDLAARTDELDQLRDAHMTTCRELEAALVSGAHSESARTTQFEDEIAAMKTAVASAEARTAELARTHDDALAAAEDRHTKLLARTTKQLEEKHLTTRKSMQETVDGLYVELGQSATELEAAEEHRRTSLKDLEQRLAREAKEREEKQIADALSKLSSSAQTDAAAAQEQMERECTARDAEIKALQKALLDARAECETDVSNAHAEAAEKLQCELDEANARGAAAAADLKAAHAAENERLRQESKAAVEAAHLAKADELTAQETAWKQRRDTAVHETRKSVVSEAECASAQRIAEVEEIHRLALAAAQADIESVQSNATTLVQARDEASRKITELEKSLSETDTKILALGTEVEQKGGELLGQRREFTEQLATLRGEADVLVEQHKIEMERLVTG